MNNSSLNIMIVDDDEQCVKGLEFPLKVLDHQVVSYNSPVQALKDYCHQSFDLVISDYKMHPLNGIELFKQLKKINPNVKLILVTAYGDMTMAEEAMNNQIFGFLSKPIDIKKLFKLIKTLMEINVHINSEDNQKQIEVDKLSHEIKNPLSAIINSLDLIKQNLNKSNLVDYIDIIKESGFYINDILDSYTKINRVSQSTGKLVDVDLLKLTSNVIELLKTNLVNELVSIRFHYAPSLARHFLADKKAIIEILYNLINNAIQYTKEGFIDVSIDQWDEHDHPDQVALCLSVKDTGIGISSGELDKIFQSYFRSNKAIVNKVGNQGLGLSIVYEIVKQLGGKIEVDSKLNEGTLFKVYLHLEKSQIVDENGDYEGNIHEQYHRALIIDDKADIGRILSIFLSKLNYQSVICETSREAVKELESGKFDLIFIELNLSNTSTFLLLESIHAANAQSIPLIAMSGFSIKDIHANPDKYGIKWFMEKPFTLDGVRTSIQKVLDPAHLTFENHQLTSEQINSSMNSLICALEARDQYTKGHSESVATLVASILIYKGAPRKEIKEAYIGAKLHDIGKLGIGDDILLKEGPLTPEERQQIELHPVIGGNILENISDLVRYIPIVKHHHERFDGKGYPDRLKGCAIPFLARLTAVVDTFDAITSHRAYRGRKTIAEALEIIKESRGTQLCPESVDLFLKWVNYINLKNEENSLDLSILKSNLDKIIFYTDDTKAKGHILVVDDSSSMRQMLMFLLSEKGFTLYEARGGIQGLEKLENLDSCDLVITDLHMPKMNGLEFISAIRALENNNHIPVIVLTAESEEGYRMNAIESGATACLSKPFDSDGLIELVNKVLGRK